MYKKHHFLSSVIEILIVRIITPISYIFSTSYKIRTEDENLSAASHTWNKNKKTKKMGWDKTKGDGHKLTRLHQVDSQTFTSSFKQWLLTEIGVQEGSTWRCLKKSQILGPVARAQPVRGSWGPKLPLKFISVPLSVVAPFVDSAPPLKNFWMRPCPVALLPPLVTRLSARKTIYRRQRPSKSEKFVVWNLCPRRRGYWTRWPPLRRRTHKVLPLAVVGQNRTRNHMLKGM